MTAPPNDPTPLESFTKLVKEHHDACRVIGLDRKSAARIHAAERAIIAAYSALLTRQPSADSDRLDDLEAWLRAVPGRSLSLPREDQEHFTLFLHPGEQEDTHRISMWPTLRETIDAIDSARHREGT